MGNCLKTEVSDDESLLGESDQETNHQEPPNRTQRNGSNDSRTSGQSGRRRDRRRRTRVRGYQNVLSIPDPTHYFNLGTVHLQTVRIQYSSYSYSSRTDSTNTYKMINLVISPLKLYRPCQILIIRKHTYLFIYMSKSRYKPYHMLHMPYNISYIIWFGMTTCIAQSYVLWAEGWFGFYSEC